MIPPLAVLLAAVLVLTACASSGDGGATSADEPAAPDAAGHKASDAPTAGSAGQQQRARLIRLHTASGAVVVQLNDTPAARDLLTMLPLTSPFEDFHAAEKISYLPRRLRLGDSPTGGAVPGDLIYYVPWGNIAVFYAGGSEPSPDVVPLGAVVDGRRFVSELDRGPVTVEIYNTTSPDKDHS